MRGQAKPTLHKCFPTAPHIMKRETETGRERGDRDKDGGIQGERNRDKARDRGETGTKRQSPGRIRPNTRHKDMRAVCLASQWQGQDRDKKLHPRHPGHAPCYVPHCPGLMSQGGSQLPPSVEDTPGAQISFSGHGDLTAASRQDWVTPTTLSRPRREATSHLQPWKDHLSPWRHRLQWQPGGRASGQSQGYPLNPTLSHQTRSCWDHPTAARAPHFLWLSESLTQGAAPEPREWGANRKMEHRTQKPRPRAGQS